MGQYSKDTSGYYDQNAQKYVQDTLALDLSNLYEPFLELIPSKGRILDAGCGSGRDTLYFREKGFTVLPFDSSTEIVRIASEIIGDTVLMMSFQELEFKDEFDGIWACSSLLHVPKAEMDDVMERISRALKTGGILYTSFKYGSGEIISGLRMFNNYTEESFSLLIKKHPSLRIEKIWKTEDVRPDRNGEFWLNALLEKD
jgi:SAM-dependent methyltransferase